jgi:thioredoxin 1
MSRQRENRSAGSPFSMRLLRICVAVLITASCLSCSGGSNPIYAPGEVTQEQVDSARKQAQTTNKYLMVEFGADWCVDCVVLARTLDSGETGEYFQKTFSVLKVDVGKFDKNLKIAQALGVDITRGIPTALFYAPDGTRIGATNKGELEPSSKFGAKQIMAFLKEVTEHRNIVNPARY